MRARVAVASTRCRAGWLRTGLRRLRQPACVDVAGSGRRGSCELVGRLLSPCSSPGPPEQGRRSSTVRRDREERGKRQSTGSLPGPRRRPRSLLHQPSLEMLSTKCVRLQAVRVLAGGLVVSTVFSGARPEFVQRKKAGSSMGAAWSLRARPHHSSAFAALFRNPNRGTRVVHPNTHRIIHNDILRLESWSRRRDMLRPAAPPPDSRRPWWVKGHG
jgi:hypothetical protein